MYGRTSIDLASNLNMTEHLFCFSQLPSLIPLIVIVSPAAASSLYGDDYQGSSIDGDSNSRVSRASTNTSTPATTTPTPGQTNNATPPPSSPPPSLPTPNPREPRAGGVGREAAARAVRAAAVTGAVGAAELLGPWGRGTQEDEARALASGELLGSVGVEGQGGEEASAGVKGDGGDERDEVPQEPAAGEGVCASVRMVMVYVVSVV